MSKFKPYKKIDILFNEDFDEFYRNGVRGIIFDIDNTLVEDNAKLDDRARSFIESLKNKGFKLCIVSNNGLERVREFCEPLGVKFVYKAKKPSKAGFIKAMRLMGTKRADTISIGDQIFTDVLGANRAGIKSYLCEPINRKTERKHIKFKRIFEKLFDR